jgi:preprotein translocase subunit SecY
MSNNPVANLFRVPELKEKILFTLFILLIYRIGAHITVPGLDVGILRQQFGALQNTFFGIYDMFVGGGLSRATIFALGIMPYISASIMFQLLAAVFPTVEKLQKEGEDWRPCRRTDTPSSCSPPAPCGFRARSSSSPP